MARDEVRRSGPLTESDAKVLDVAMALPVRDAIALVLVHQARRHTYPWSTTNRLLEVEDVAPEAADSDVEAATKLMGYAPRYGEQLLHGIRDGRREPRERALSDLRERHPGFLDSTYSVVGSWGCFLAR